MNATSAVEIRNSNHLCVYIARSLARSYAKPACLLARSLTQNIMKKVHITSVISILDGRYYTIAIVIGIARIRACIIFNPSNSCQLLIVNTI